MKPQTLPPLRLGLYRSRLLSLYIPVVHLSVATVLSLAPWQSAVLIPAIGLVLVSLVISWKRHIHPYSFDTEVPLSVDGQNEWRLGAASDVSNPLKLAKYNRGRYGVILTFAKKSGMKFGLVLLNDSFAGDDLRKLHVRLRHYQNS